MIQGWWKSKQTAQWAQQTAFETVQKTAEDGSAGGHEKLKSELFRIMRSEVASKEIQRMKDRLSYE